MSERNIRFKPVTGKTTTLHEIAVGRFSQDQAGAVMDTEGHHADA